MNQPDLIAYFVSGLPDHIFRIKGLVEFLLGEKAFLKDYVVDRAVGLKGLFGDLGAGLVADDRVEGSHDADAVLHHLVAALLVDGDALHALLTLSMMDSAMTGSMTFSWSCPASAANETVVSLPITLKQT